LNRRFRLEPEPDASTARIAAKEKFVTSNAPSYPFEVNSTPKDRRPKGLTAVAP
jgi:hypothetical protein